MKLKLLPLNALMLINLSSPIYPSNIVLKTKEEPEFDPVAAACFLETKGTSDVFGCAPLVNDPEFMKQWYIVPRPERVFGNKITHDLGILEVWLEDRIYGEGVVVVDFDDGLDFEHPDLRGNFDSRFALDFCHYQYYWLPANLFPWPYRNKFSSKSGNKFQRQTGNQNPWQSGNQQQWQPGNQQQWQPGNQFQWQSGSQFQWQPGSQFQWQPGNQFQWQSGSQFQWQPGNQFQWQHGNQIFWQYGNQLPYQPVALFTRPSPHDNHGTRAAGIIAMGINNNLCGTGIAPLVTLGAFRVQSPHNPICWHYSLTHATNFMNNIDIAVYGFGPRRGNGILPAQQQYLERLEKTSKFGRGGKGIIHVWSVGNNRLGGFSCVFNSFLNNIHTIAVAGVNPFGGYTSFSNKCTAIMVAAPTSSILPLFMSTTGLNGMCTDDFGGTSASGPIVAGILALLLNASSWLTLRDVQHLITVTSTTNDLIASSFQVNGAGFLVSHDFGFGIINAKNLVRRSYDWKSVPEMRTCVIPVTVAQPVFEQPDFLYIEIDTNACQDTADEINYLEHVQLSAQLGYTNWNTLQIDLTSPRGTRAALLHVEANNPHEGDAYFIIDSIITWGENPRGKWEVMVHDSISLQEQDGMYRGHISSVKLKLFGTKEKPPHYD